MLAPLQHNGARLSKLTTLLAAAKSAGQKHIEQTATIQDATKWGDIAPPGDLVTEGYINANTNIVGLISALALHKSQSTAASARGDLYPFVCGAQKTNSLLFMAEWLTEIHTAQLLLLHQIKVSEGMQLVAEHSKFWHTLNALACLNKWVGLTPASYDIALQTSASAKLSGNQGFAAACQNLAHAAFILACPELPHPPSSSMTDRLWDVLANKKNKDDEISALFPAVVESRILRLQREMPKYCASEGIWAKLETIAEMKGLPTTLVFDI